MTLCKHHSGSIKTNLQHMHTKILQLCHKGVSILFHPHHLIPGRTAAAPFNTVYVVLVKISKPSPLRCSLSGTTQENVRELNGDSLLSAYSLLIPYLGNGTRLVLLFSCMCEAEWITCWQQRTVQISPHSKLQGGIPATPHEAPPSR